jgi:DNA invertase Pin-like site-specific DNA recombinase
LYNKNIVNEVNDMTIFGYLYNGEGNLAIETQAHMQAYLDAHKLEVNDIVECTDEKGHWQKRPIGVLLEGGRAQSGDVIVVYEAADLARSTCQMLEILSCATQKQVNIHFVKYDRVFLAQKNNDLKSLLNLMQCIEGDYISRRTTDALARRKAAGLPLGRPKGRRNKSLKLDKHKKEIMKYLSLGISKASIAKLVGCHPQTLYDWIDRHEIHAPHKGVSIANENELIEMTRKAAEAFA